MANGWTDERRKRQSELIRTWEPWKKNTGPKTKEGKMRSSVNALKTGEFSAVSKDIRRQIAKLNRMDRAIKKIYLDND